MENVFVSSSHVLTIRFIQKLFKTRILDQISFPPKINQQLSSEHFIAIPFPAWHRVRVSMLQVTLCPINHLSLDCTAVQANCHMLLAPVVTSEGETRTLSPECVSASGEKQHADLVQRQNTWTRGFHEESTSRMNAVNSNSRYHWQLSVFPLLPHDILICKSYGEPAGVLLAL